jgi:hypothetical protein
MFGFLRGRHKNGIEQVADQRKAQQENAKSSCR